MRLVPLILLVACSKKEAPLAELTRADGPVERQAGTGDWASAAVGTGFFRGDAARTADSTAEFAVAGGGQIAMQKHTVLRFGADGQNKIAVELGAIDLSGTGNYGLDLGEVRLTQPGRVRVAKDNGKNTVTLAAGTAQLATADGKTLDLVVGADVDPAGAPPPDAAPAIDAAVADAAVVEPPDAAVETSDATIDVTGRRAEVLAPGETRWKPLAAGAGVLAKGAKIRTGAGTTAKLVAGGTMLDLAGGSRVVLTDDDRFSLEAGSAVAGGEGTIALPGGAVTLAGSPAASRLETGKPGTKVSVQRGTAKLTGTAGSELAMSRGESATLLANGTIRPLEAIPQYFDLRLAAGESATIHDPRPPTAVQLRFGGKCAAGGIVELDKDPRFRTAKISGGTEAANHHVRTGTWFYRLRCTAGASEGAAVASGRISVTPDSGTRSLPPKPGVNPFVIDGKPWSYSYQSAIPDLQVTFPGTAVRFRLHLVRGAIDLAFESKSTSLRVPGSALSEGAYTYWFERDGVRQDKSNVLKIDFDQTAPQVYIELPVYGRAWGSGDIHVKGAVLPGWVAAVSDVAVPIDPRTRRFDVMVGAPAGNALAIRLAHPQRGVHYFLRRPK